MTKNVFMEWDKHYKEYSFSCSEVSFLEKENRAKKISIFILLGCIGLMQFILSLFTYSERLEKVRETFLTMNCLAAVFSIYLYLPLTRFIYSKLEMELLDFQFFKNGILAKRKIENLPTNPESKNINFNYNEITKIQINELASSQYLFEGNRHFKIEWELKSRSYTLFFLFWENEKEIWEVFTQKLAQLYEKGIEILEIDSEGNLMYLLQKQDKEVAKQYWDLIEEIGKAAE